MDRAAIFVDAGYLFAQGSAAIKGAKAPRTDISIDIPKAIGKLKSLLAVKASHCQLLRVYWYDGVRPGAPINSDQATLAGLDDVKLRLGFINGVGEQKGVDSLIVTDLIELARLKSISDAILLSGDEDIRIGVQIAQNYGIRVHLLGIVPSRGSQSQQLLHEADTTTEWSEADIREFLTVRPLEPVPVVSASSSISSSTTVFLEIGPLVNNFSKTLQTTELDGIVDFQKSQHGFPADIDKRFLRFLRSSLGRDLTGEEKRSARSALKAEIKTRKF